MIGFIRVTCLQILCKQKRTAQEYHFQMSILNPIRELKHRRFLETEVNRSQFPFVFGPIMNILTKSVKC